MANANSTIEIELEIKQALDQLNKLQDELKNSSKGFSQAGKSAQRFERVIKSAMNGVATAMEKSLSIITSFRTALVGLVGVYSASEFVQFGANFEREISKLNALTRATETEQLRLRKAIREVGSSTAFTATQAAEAANVLAAIGRNSTQISKELGVVVKVAGATSTAIETVSEAVSAQMNVFGESAEQVGNVFAAAYSTSAANVEKLQTALGQIGPVAKTAGLDLTQTAGAIAFLVDRGLRAEAAGTALRGVLLRLIDPPKTVQKEFEALGFTFTDIQEIAFEDKLQKIADGLENVAGQGEKNRILAAIFGDEALGAATNFISELQKGNRVIETQAEKLRQATDAAGLYKQITSDLRGAIDELISAVQDKLLTAFQAAEPFVKEIVTQLKDAVNSLTTEQIIDAVENIGVTLVKGAFGFYDLIRVAINAVYEFLNSPAFQQVIQIAKDSLASLGFTSLDDQIAVAEQEVLKQAVLIRELELSKDSPFSIDFLTDQTIGAVQEQLDAAKAVLANLKAQKAEQESSLFLIKDRADLEERLIAKIREGAQLIRERAQAQAQLGDVQESQTNQIASSASATVPILNDISEQLENVKQAGEAAFGILTQQIKDIYSVAFDDDLPILDRVNQIDAFVKSIESSLPQLAGVLEPGQFQAVQTILVDLLNVSDALDKIGQSEAAEAFEKMGREIKKLDPKQQAEFARNLQAQFDQYEQIEEQVNQINERGIERTRVEQINYDYANEIAKVKADQNLSAEQQVSVVNALEAARDRELKNVKKNLSFQERITKEMSEQLGLSKEGQAIAGTVTSGVFGAGENAGRAEQIGQAYQSAGGGFLGVINAIGAAIFSNQKVMESIERFFTIIFDILDPLLDLVGDLIEAINRLIASLAKGIGDGIQSVLDQLGVGQDSYLFGGGFARDFEQFSYDVSGGLLGVNNREDTGLSRDEYNAYSLGISGLSGQETIDDLLRNLSSVGLTGVLEGEDYKKVVEEINALARKGDATDQQRAQLLKNAAAAQTLLFDRIEEQAKQISNSEALTLLEEINQRGVERNEIDQIRINYSREIKEVSENLILTEEDQIRVVNALEEARNREIEAIERQQQLLDIQTGGNELTKILDTLKDTFDRIIDLVEDLKDQTLNLLFSDKSLAPASVRFDTAATRYQELLAAALDPEATEENVKDFQAFVDTYLKSAQDVFKSSSQYQNIFDSVLADIEEVSNFVSIAMPISEIESVKKQLVEVAEEFGIGIEEVVEGLDRLVLALTFRALVVGVPVQTVVDTTNSDLVIEAIVTAVEDPNLSDTQIEAVVKAIMGAGSDTVIDAIVKAVQAPGSDTTIKAVVNAIAASSSDLQIEAVVSAVANQQLSDLEIEAIVTAVKASGSDTVIEAVVSAVEDKILSDTEIEAIVTAVKASGSNTVISAVVSAIAASGSDTQIEALVTAIAASGSDTQIEAIVKAIMASGSDTQIEAIVSAVASNTPVISAIVAAVAANTPVVTPTVTLDDSNISEAFDSLSQTLENSIGSLIATIQLQSMLATATAEGIYSLSASSFNMNGAQGVISGYSVDLKPRGDFSNYGYAEGVQFTGALSTQDQFSALINSAESENPAIRNNPYYVMFPAAETGNTRKARLFGFTDLTKAEDFFNYYSSRTFSYINDNGTLKYGFRQGGLVPDPMDTIPAMLSPGEYILSPETVRRYGVSNLNRLNSGDSAAINATSDPEVKRLLAELIVAVRENDTEVNVYTDMQGQTKAGIEEFRSELRERTRRQGDKFLPARYI